MVYLGGMNQKTQLFQLYDNVFIGIMNEKPLKYSGFTGKSAPIIYRRDDFQIIFLPYVKVVFTMAGGSVNTTGS
jgi:hypothetical protein